MHVRITGLSTANPPLRLSQEEVYRAYLEHLSLSEKARALLYRFLIENRSIGQRYFAMERITDALDNDPEVLIARYRRFGVPMAVQAARGALAEAGLVPEEVDALVVNTCTGYLCPGLTSYVAEELGLRPDLRPFDLMGMGCGGAIPNLETAYNHLQVHPGHTVLSIAVEVCTATIYFSEDPDILLSNSLFGDGAAAVVLTNREEGAGLLRLRSFASGLFPEHRRYLRYITQDARLRNVLSPRVPVLGARHAREVIGRLLGQAGLSPAEVAHWIVHPGGASVIDALQEALDLPDGAVEPARRVLHQYGNMSSASVLFVLEEVRRRHAPQAGDLGVLSSFGAGFSAFAALVEFDPPAG